MIMFLLICIELAGFVLIPYYYAILIDIISGKLTKNERSETGDIPMYIIWLAGVIFLTFICLVSYGLICLNSMFIG